MVNYVSENFENGANGASLTTANTTSDLVSPTPPTFINDPHDGALAMNVVVGTTAVAVNARFPFGATRAEVFASYWLKAIGAWPTGNGSPHALRTGSTIKTDAQVPGGVLRMRGGGTGQTLVWTAPSALPVDQWLLVSHHARVSDLTQDIKVYDAQGNVLQNSGSQPWAAGAAVDNIQVGAVTAIASLAWHLDTLLVADTAVVPPTPPVTVTRVRYRKLANGSFQAMERYKI